MKKTILTVITLMILIGITVTISIGFYTADIEKTTVSNITSTEDGLCIEIKKVPGITGYQLQYSTSPEFTADETKAVKTFITYSSPQNLIANKKYYIRVRSFKTANHKTVYSAWSESKSAKTEKKSDKLLVSPTAVTVEIGKTFHLRASCIPENAGCSKIQFHSSDETIAAVSANGSVTGLREGRAKIIVTSSDPKQETTVDITVKKPFAAVKGIHITNKKGLSVEAGKTVKINLEFTPDNATDKSVIWEVDDTSKAEIDENGLLTAIRPTEGVEITARTQNGEFKSSYTLKISKEKGYLSKEQLDKMDLSQIDNLMIVAHPDDETFWGGLHVLNDRYLVVVITNGFYKERVSDFTNVINQYGNDEGIILSYPDIKRKLYSPQGKYTGYETDYWSSCKNAIADDISTLLNYKKWNSIVTHNPDGEYNKYHHKTLCLMVTKCISSSKNAQTPLYYFGHYHGKDDEISEPKMNVIDLQRKKRILKMYLPTAKGAYNAFHHMLPYENWILMQDW